MQHGGPSQSPSTQQTPLLTSASAYAQSSAAIPLVPKTRAPRTNRACTTCRKRKVRCDGAYGAPTEDSVGGVAEVPCGPCKAHGVECTFEARVPKDQKSNPYIQSLERRLAAMEALLASRGTALPPSEPEATARVASLPTAPALPPPVPLTDGMSGNAMPPWGGQAGQAAPTGLDEIQELGELMDDLAIETDRYVGRGSGLHLVEATHAHLSRNAGVRDPSPSLVERIMHADDASSAMTRSALPPDDLEGPLIEAAFRVLDGWEILVRQHYDECSAAGLRETDRSFRSLYFAILAVGSRFVDDDRLDPPVPFSLRPSLDLAEVRVARGYQFYEASMAAATPPLLLATLFDLLASILQVFFLMSCTGLVTTWNAAGVAVRRAIDAGAHREQRAKWTASPLVDQLRKRAFHTLVASDIFCSSMLGRPLAIHDSDYDVVLPLNIETPALLEWDRAARLSKQQGLPPPPPPPPQTDANPWDSIGELYHITGTALTLLYSFKRDLSKIGDGVRDLDSRLNAWVRNIPPAYQWNPSTMDNKYLAAAAWIACSFYSCQMLIHREFLAPARSRALGFPSLAICTNAARSCARVIETLEERGLLVEAFDWVPDIAITSGLMLVLSTFSQPTKPGAPPATLTPSARGDVQRLLRALEILAATSFMARQCLKGLQELAALVAPGILNQPASTPSSGGSPASTVPVPKKRSITEGATPPSTSFAVDGAVHKTRKVGNLPFSTHDLSASTFNGRATFASRPTQHTPTSLPYPPLTPQQLPDPNLVVPNPLESYDFSSFRSPAPPSLPYTSFSPLASSSTSQQSHAHPHPPPPSTSYSSFLSQPSPPPISFGALDGSWTSSFNAAESTAFPPAVEQSFADLMASFGVGTSGEGSGGQALWPSDSMSGSVALDGMNGQEGFGTSGTVGGEGYDSTLFGVSPFPPADHGY
ncbi:hypothetical protein JCM8547_004739 [Rhodosporidiobolus lusitaniae]